MKAIVLYGPRKLEVTGTSVPVLPRGWVLVKTELVGICGTDKAFYTGTYKLLKTPLIPGHEVVGVVVEGSEELKGKRVVPEINFPCGKCEYCRLGLYTHCTGKKTLGIDLDGGMAEYFIAPVEALHVYPGPPEMGIFVEPLAAVLRALMLRPPKPGDKVAVIGTGNLAWLVVQALKKLYELHVELVVREGSVKAKHFKDLVDGIVHSSELVESTYDVVFEVSGDPNALNTAIRLVKPRGIIHLKSTPGTGAHANMTSMVVKEAEIVCSRCGTFREFKYAVKLLVGGKVVPRLDRVYKLDDGREAFEESLKPEYFKVAIRA
ncbi:MAG: alcohol dehydrogenase catalytic domain-containing protein [Desulfurococcaceae archaeon]